jgi:hypothetical protein
MAQQPPKRTRPSQKRSQPSPSEQTPSSAPEPTGTSATPRRRRTQTQADTRVMATFYLPLSYVEQFDRAWVARRLKDRKV